MVETAPGSSELIAQGFQKVNLNDACVTTLTQEGQSFAKRMLTYPFDINNQLRIQLNSLMRYFGNDMTGSYFFEHNLITISGNKAQSKKEISLHIDSEMFFRLTDTGKDILKKEQDSLDDVLSPELYPVDENGFVKMSFRHAAGIFGQYIIAGSPLPIEDNTIYVNTSDPMFPANH